MFSYQLTFFLFSEARGQEPGESDGHAEEDRRQVRPQAQFGAHGH